MNKLLYLIIMVLISTLPLKAAEKKDCSKYSKLSKEFMSCKSNNIKSGIKNNLTGSNNPIDKIIKYQKKAWSEATK